MTRETKRRLRAELARLGGSADARVLKMLASLAKKYPEFMNP